MIETSRIPVAPEEPHPNQFCRLDEDDEERGDWCETSSATSVPPAYEECHVLGIEHATCGGGDVRTVIQLNDQLAAGGDCVNTICWAPGERSTVGWSTDPLSRNRCPVGYRSSP